MWKSLIPDRLIWMLLTAIAIASIFPATGWAIPVFSRLTDLAIMALFFLHGVNLPLQQVVSGLTNWRLHLLVLGTTYIFFPIMGFLFQPVLAPIVTPQLYTGVIFLCMVSSAVQSSIVMTSIGRGNVSAAICSASASNMLGVFVTPLLVLAMLHPEHTGFSFGAIESVMILLLVPFVIGIASQRWLQTLVKGHAGIIKLFDQGSLVLIVYTAFSASVVAGLWSHTQPAVLASLFGICAFFLTIALISTLVVARLLGFSKEDEITIVFCGSKKSLASGAPMAKVLFSASAFGTMVLPIIIYNQMQIFVCSFIARAYAKRHTVLEETARNLSKL